MASKRKCTFKLAYFGVPRNESICLFNMTNKTIQEFNLVDDSKDWGATRKHYWDYSNRLENCPVMEVLATWVE
jgi:hypothetical protein